jgi:hypothetical protein
MTSSLSVNPNMTRIAEDWVSTVFQHRFSALLALVVTYVVRKNRSQKKDGIRLHFLLQYGTYSMITRSWHLEVPLIERSLIERSKTLGGKTLRGMQQENVSRCHDRVVINREI